MTSMRILGMVREELQTPWEEEQVNPSLLTLVKVGMSCEHNLELKRELVWKTVNLKSLNVCPAYTMRKRPLNFCSR